MLTVYALLLGRRDILIPHFFIHMEMKMNMSLKIKTDLQIYFSTMLVHKNKTVIHLLSVLVTFCFKRNLLVSTFFCFILGPQGYGGKPGQMGKLFYLTVSH